MEYYRPPNQNQTVEHKNPTLKITRQPEKRKHRFRYESDGSKHGGMRGESSTEKQIVYPSIMVEAYTGRVKVFVALVTDDSSSAKVQLHAHSLVNNGEVKHGWHTFELEGRDPEVTFKEKDAISIRIENNKDKVLKERILQSQFLNAPESRYTEDYEIFAEAFQDQDHHVNRITGHVLSAQQSQQLETSAASLAKAMNMRKCRLYFEAFCEDGNGRFSKQLAPVLSDVIFDAKTPLGCQLKIDKLDKVSSNVLGGDEVWLRGKIDPRDTEVRFFDKKGWEDFASFQEPDVDKTNMIFKTPAYKDENIEHPVDVFVELRRKSDNECKSEERIFKFKPKVDYVYTSILEHKKNKPIPEILLQMIQDNNSRQSVNSMAACSMMPTNTTLINNNNNGIVHRSFMNCSRQSIGMNNTSFMYNNNANLSQLPPFNLAAPQQCEQRTDTMSGNGNIDMNFIGAHASFSLP